MPNQVDLLKGPLEFQEVGEPSQLRVKVDYISIPMSKNQKRAQKLKEKEDKRAIIENQLKLEQMEMEKHEAAREKHRQDDIASQNECHERLEAVVMDNQSYTWQSVGNMRCFQSPMPLFIASFYLNQPFLSICVTGADVIGAIAPTFSILADGRLSLIPPVPNAHALLPRNR